MQEITAQTARETPTGEAQDARISSVKLNTVNRTYKVDHNCIAFSCWSFFDDEFSQVVAFAKSMCNNQPWLDKAMGHNTVTCRT